MENFCHLLIENLEPGLSDLLIAQLSVLGFEGFEEAENSLAAYIEESKLSKREVTELMKEYNLPYSIESIPPTNWNQIWEESFQPVCIGNFVAVRANFHPPFQNIEHEIVITPKMSFGTGHHATTYLMLEAMRAIDFSKKAVLDFGTGTGILAILAEKLGAASITAIDIDEWSIDNATENSRENGCRKIKLIQQDHPKTGEGKFDVILANINKNIIINNLKELISQLNTGGILLLSGLLVTDEKDILEETKKYPLTHEATFTKEKWILMQYVKD